MIIVRRETFTKIFFHLDTIEKKRNERLEK